MSQTQSNSEFLPARNILQQAIYMPYVAGRNNASYVIMRGDSCTMPVAEGPGVSPAFQCVAVRLVWCTVEKAAILVPQWRHKLAALHHTGRCSTKGCSLRCKMTATMLFSCWCMVRRDGACSTNLFLARRLYTCTPPPLIGVVAPPNGVSRLHSSNTRLQMLLNMAA